MNDAKRGTRASVRYKGGSRRGYLSRQVEQLSIATNVDIRSTTTSEPRRVFNTAMTTSFSASLDAIKAALPANLQSPRVAIICGSGLSGIVDALRDVVLVPYKDIPGFSTSTGKYSAQTRIHSSNTELCSPWTQERASIRLSRKWRRGARSGHAGKGAEDRLGVFPILIFISVSSL